MKPKFYESARARWRLSNGAACIRWMLLGISLTVANALAQTVHIAEGNSARVAATVRSQAEWPSAPDAGTAVQRPPHPSRDLTVAAASPCPFRDDRILIKPSSNAHPAALSEFHSRHKTELLGAYPALGNIQLLKVPEGETVRSLQQKYQGSGLVEYAEPDYWVRLATGPPNDPLYTAGLLWGLNNSGQFDGLADADIDAPEAWGGLNSASNVIVALVDSGVRYTHEDLAANMWVNPLDGGHGLNALTGSNNPNDENGHGTLIAGILGAVGNNATGVVGVAWRVQIMACKFLGTSGGSVSDAVACIDYARTNGARIINASWGVYAVSLSLSNAFRRARAADILVVAAAGNDGIDIDMLPFHPASFDFDNIVAVAATTRSDERHLLSNFGALSVDLAAPGLDIISTSAGGDDAYFMEQGTSLAAGYVSGAAALLRARFPTESAQQIIQRLKAGTDPLNALAGLCVTGGRLNLRKSLEATGAAAPRLMALPLVSGEPFQLRLSGDPQRAYVIQATTNLVDWTPAFTNVTAANGQFLYTSSPATDPKRAFFRAQSAE